MTMQCTLDNIRRVAGRHSCKVVATRGHVGKFRDVEIMHHKKFDVGLLVHFWPAIFVDVMAGIRQEFGPHRIEVSWIDNKEHPDYGEPMLIVHSMWIEDTEEGGAA